MLALLVARYSPLCGRPSDPQTINGKTVQTSIKVSPALSYRIRSPAGLDAEANLTMGEYARVTTERKVPRNDSSSVRQWLARMTGASSRELRSQNALIASDVSQMGSTVTFMDFKLRMSNVQLTRLEGKVDNLTKAVQDELQGKVDKVEGKVDKLTENVTELQGKVDKLTENVDKLTENVAKLGEKVNELGEKVNELPTRAEFYGFAIALLIVPVFSSWHSHTRCDKMNKMMNNHNPRCSFIRLGFMAGVHG